MARTFPWDLNLGIITTSPGNQVPLRSVELMRAAACAVELAFRQDDGPVTPDGIQLGAVVKEKGKYDEDSLIVAPTFTLDADRSVYTANLNFITDALNELLKVDTDEDNDVAKADLQLAFGYSFDGMLWTPSQNIALTLDNNAFRGDEGAAAALDSAADWEAIHGMLNLPLVTGLTGGGSTKLDGWQLTAGLSVPRFYRVIIAGVPREYMLRAGTDAEASPGIIRPDDYAGGTNELVYAEIG